MQKSQIRIALLLWGICISISCTSTVKKEYNWKQREGYRWAELLPGRNGEAGFEQKNSSQTNISFRNDLSKEDISNNRHYLNGSGVALGDIDGDGWIDIYFAQLDGPNKLYKNLGGFQFVDITDAAGVAHKGYYSTGVTFADVDGDSDLDLLVTSVSQNNVLYINDGTGRFKRKENGGLGSSNGSLSMALADIDEDNDLDLYITNYKKKTVLDLFDITDLSWEKTIKEQYDKNNVDQSYTLLPPYDEHYTILYKKDELPERREIGRKDELYINSGDGTFGKATDLERRFLDADGNPQGLEQDWGLAAKYHDINQDGLPDLYVCNDFWTPDRVWINQGEGMFREIDPLAIRNMSFSSMSVDFSDINRDGHWDFFVTEMLSPEHERRLRQFIPDDPYPVYIGQYNNQPQYNRNSFYLNRGDDTYTEISYFSGLEASEWSWASRFLDVDLDGYEDLLITTGYSFDVQDLDAQNEWRNEITRKGEDIHIFPPLELPNKIFRNNGDLSFTDVSSEWGFEGTDISHGLATADFDHDGDLDVAINRLNREALIYENTTSTPRIAIRLVGNAPNTQATGAKVELHGGPVAQQDEISAGGEYLSGSDPLIMFAATEENSNHVLTVTWPDGKQTVIDSIRTNRIYKIDEPESSPEAIVSITHETKRETIFQDVSDRIDHRHHEEPYDDFYIQPLLPHKLSRQGPGVSWIDYDSDGDDDLFITSGRSGRLGAFENTGDGTFNPISQGRLTQTTTGDQTTVLGWSDEQGTKLIVGTANYEPGDIHAPSALIFSPGKGMKAEPDTIPGIFSTTGPLTAADYDGDGDLDLFVGGRFVPAHYPADATSRFFKNEGGRFVPDEPNTHKLRELGLVTGAVFSDIDGDRDPDLIISREWDSLVLFENNNGNFQDVSSRYGLNNYNGWWNGVATGDFNGDGHPDIVATNRGKNSPYQLDTNHPLRMYYQDFNRDGRVDIIESYYDSSIGAYVPRRQMKDYESISAAFSGGISSNKEFANTSLRQILRIDPGRILSKEINTLAHILFLNQGGKFSAHPLPAVTQFSAAFDAVVFDYDNDGSEDLFLSQNTFIVPPNTPRLDAGRGLLLKGDGHGKFKAISGQKSGITVYGQQRGAAASDFNGDGRMDLAVSQNEAATKLYLNQTPEAGITVRLESPGSNSTGIGSSVRLVYEDGSKGPRREVRTGDGYWSQDSAVQVLGVAEDKTPEHIEVNWFDGTRSTLSVSPDMDEYTVNHSSVQ